MSWLARFDLQLMRPPALPTGPVPLPAQAAVLRAWCEAGALPRMSSPLVAAQVSPHTWLDAWACELDGSLALAQLGRWAGLALRLRVKLQDQWPGRPLRPADPWDCGWLQTAGLAQAAAFRPRRATLLLVAAPQPQVIELLDTLRAQQAHYRRPLRVLVVCEQPFAGLPSLDAPPVA